MFRNDWTVLPMPTEVISTIHQLGDNGIVFTKKYSKIVTT